MAHDDRPCADDRAEAEESWLEQSAPPAGGAGAQEGRHAEHDDAHAGGQLERDGEPARPTAGERGGFVAGLDVPEREGSSEKETRTPRERPRLPRVPSRGSRT